MRSKTAVAVMVVVLLTLTAAVAVSAQTETVQEEQEVSKPAKGDLAIGLIALAAALSVGICAVATGIAQSRIGSAGAGTVAEKPDTIGGIILLVAIPETMVILGFVIAIVMLFTL